MNDELIAQIDQAIRWDQDGLNVGLLTRCRDVLAAAPLQRPPDPPCTCGEVDGHMVDCAVMKAQDAWVEQNDAAILAREHELGGSQTEVAPSQRRAFRYGYEAALAAHAVPRDDWCPECDGPASKCGYRPPLTDDVPAVPAAQAPTGTELVHSSYVAETTATILRLQGELAEARKTLEWIDHHSTFYDTEVQNAPTLATVTKRIWYHATDDQIAYPFSDVARRALAPAPAEKPEEGQ